MSKMLIVAIFYLFFQRLAEQDNSLAGEPSILNELEMYYKPAMEHVTAATMAAATMAEAGNSLQGFEADLVLLPLRLAFETKEPKLVETALDCLHVSLSPNLICL
jgi:hypothetical protein